MVDEVGGRAHVDARATRNGRIAAEIDVQQIRAPSERRLPNIKESFAKSDFAQGETVTKHIAVQMLQRVGERNRL